MYMQEQPSSWLNQDAVTQVIRFIFSWVILLAIGVIVSGKLLSQRLKLRAGSGQLFRIPIKGVFRIEATGAEVVLGFTFYLLSVLVLGATWGANLQPWVKSHYGIDPGQFDAIGFMSSLMSVAVSFIVYLFSAIPVSVFGKGSVRLHDQLLDRITENKAGIHAADLPEIKE